MGVAVFLLRLRQAGELLLIAGAELMILLGILGVVVNLTASKAEGGGLGLAICLLGFGVVMLVGIQKISQPKTGRSLAEVRLPFLEKKERVSWWLLDKGTEKAVVCVRHWRSGRIKGFSPESIFSLESSPITEEIRMSLIDSKHWARYVQDGVLVKLADGPRYHRRTRS
jgi:hypothetical protein